MRILETADVHARLDWLDWLTQQADQFDLVVIAGDVIRQGFIRIGTFFVPIDHSQQIEPLKAWASDYANQTTTPIVVSSGNHDQGTPETDEADATPAAEPMWEHLATLRSHFVLDGETIHLNPKTGRGLWVTVSPFHWDDDLPRAKVGFQALQDAHQRRSEAKSPEPWLLVHHRPPPGDLGGNNPIFHDVGLEKWLAKFPVDYVACGHDHEQPSISGRHIQQLGHAWCFNAGQEGPDSEFGIPNYTILDTDLKVLKVYTKGGTKEFFYDLSSGHGRTPTRRS